MTGRRCGADASIIIERFGDRLPVCAACALRMQRMKRTPERWSKGERLSKDRAAADWIED
jgi:hypothetical protein